MNNHRPADVGCTSTFRFSYLNKMIKILASFLLCCFHFLTLTLTNNADLTQIPVDFLNCVTDAL